MFTTKNLYQNDKRWNDTRLGNSSETIGGWGGLLTSITMMLNGIGYDETPETVNEKLKRAGGFLKALPISSILPYVWPNCVYRGLDRCEKSSSAPIEQIDAVVKAGKPVILEVDFQEQKGRQTHFVLVKEKRGDDYILYDPIKKDGDDPKKEVLLTTRYKYNGAKLENEISAVLWFDFLSEAPPAALKAARLPVPPAKYILFVTEDNVILRDKASVDSFPWKRMGKWTELICLEPKATAKTKLSVDGKWIRVQDPCGDQGYVSALFVTSTLPVAILPPDAQPSLLKKWCLKNVFIENPQFETWSLDGNITLHRNLVKSFDILPKNTIVNVLKSNDIIPGWSGIMYEKTYYDSSLRKWVTTRVTGRVRNTELDDYYENEAEVQKFVVDIQNQTESSTDAQQYLYIDEGEGKKSKARFNMCGELCIASIVEKDIQTVLREWREDKREVESKTSKALYDSMVGKADKPLEAGHIENLLNLHIRGENYTRYKMDKKGNPLEKYIQLADPDGYDRRASKELQEKLKEYYFITNLRIDTNTGDLKAAYSAEERNHWVVLDRITRNGSRVELYNPFPNRREEYSFGEFYRSIGGNPNSGWWIKREVNPTFARQKGSHRPERIEETFQPPKFEVVIDNRTDNEKDAEQYLYIRGEGSKPKTKLCGEFSVAFILGQSMNTSLKRWQEEKKKLGGQIEMWELVTLLQAYGFNRRKYIEPLQGVTREKEKYYIAPNTEQRISSAPEAYIKSFSIDTVLEFWKGVQPDLYYSILGDNRNDPTGPDDLVTILKAYGYDKDDYSLYRPGSQESFGYAPGRDAASLATHFLIAGVNIHGTTGRLKPTGVAHWVVVTKITPRGNLVGGNGGWVEIYNSFPNCWEEYSWREFMDAYIGPTLWIKKDVSPVFKQQTRAAAKSKENEKSSKSNAIRSGKKGNKPDLKAEKDRKRDEEKSKHKKDAKSEGFEDIPMLDIATLVRERLGVESLPREIGKWIRDASNGDSFFAEALADTLSESGLLAIHEEVVGNKKRRTAVLADLASPDTLKTAKNIVNNLSSSPENLVFRIASAVLPLFTDSAIDEIKTVQKTMPVQAYKSRPEFMAWTHGLALNISDPLETEIKNRIESLFISQKDQSKVFEAGSRIVPRFTKWAIEELEKIYYEVSEKIEKIHSDSQTSENIKRVRPPNAPEKISWAEFEEWTRGIASTPRPNVYRVRKWGDPVMKEFAFDINIKKFSSNFQAVGLYNTATDFGAISNFLIIPPHDVAWLESLQIEDDYEAKVPDWLHQKMSWLCQERGSIYMFASKEKGRSPWRRSDGIRWGTLALGGNLVKVAEWKKFDFEVTTPSGKKVRNMARLVGFTRKDMVKPLDQLLAEGLVHRCYSVNTGNVFRDSPQGIVYSPFWSPREWEFTPKPKNGIIPTDLWIPACYLENPSGGAECIPPDNLG